MLPRVSQPTELAKRQPLPQGRHALATIGSWNPDEAGRSPNDFVEMKNWRKMRPDEVETRSGIRQYKIAGAFKPLARAEYRLKNKFVDVTIALSGTNQIVAIVYDHVVNLHTIVDVCAGDVNTIACAYQYSTYLVVSVITSETDFGTYALEPSDDTLLVWGASRLLGKAVSPTPSTFSFSETVTGALVAYLPDTTAGDGWTLRYKTDQLTGEPATLPLTSVKTKYWLADSTTVQRLRQKLWTRNKKDATPDQGLDDVRHVKSRGWHYVFVLKRKVKDARQQDRIIVEAPSTDVYVEERCYMPAALTINVKGNTQLTDLIYGYNHTGSPHFQSATRAQDHWRDTGGEYSPGAIGIFDVTREGPDEGATDVASADAWGFLVGDTIGGFTRADGYPTRQDYLNLRAAFRDVYPNPGADDLRFISAWLGFFFGSDIHLSTTTPPYKLDAGSWEISNAPNVILSWSAFGITDPTAYQIEVYRTAYSFADPKLNATRSPGYAAHKYGFVGTIEKDGTLTDDVSDVNLITSRTPLDAEGFLAGQFAGATQRPYQSKDVLGDLYTKHWVKTPWKGVQAFTYKVEDTATDPFVHSDFEFASDGLAKTKWYYAYQDSDGRLSDAVPIGVQDILGDFAADKLNVAFLFPRGYAVDVTSAVLIRSLHNGVSRTYYREAVIPLTEGVFFSVKKSVAGLSVITPAANADGSLSTRDVETSHDPGTILHSEYNDPWDWPIENVENLHDENPVTAMYEVMGRLYVGSDRGVVNTLLDGHIEPVSTSQTGAGCVSRWAYSEVQNYNFMLSAFGMVYVEGSGLKEFPIRMQGEIAKYIRERIAGKSPLTNARRACIAYHGQRSELYISFPSSVDLGGTLPARTFIYKFIKRASGPDEVHAYEFDLTPGTAEFPKPQSVVLHLPHADGSLWSVFSFDAPDPDDPQIQGYLVIQDNDDPDHEWQGNAWLQYQDHMGSTNVTKILREARFELECHARLYVASGISDAMGRYTEDHGTLNPACTERELNLQWEGNQAEYHVNIAGNAIETTGCPVNFRVTTRPNDDERHFARLISLDFGVDALHAHTSP